MRSWGETGEGHLNLISVNDKELGGKPTLSEEKNTFQNPGFNMHGLN